MVSNWKKKGEEPRIQFPSAHDDCLVWHFSHVEAGDLGLNCDEKSAEYDCTQLKGKQGELLVSHLVCLEVGNYIGGNVAMSGLYLSKLRAVVKLLREQGRSLAFAIVWYMELTPDVSRIFATRVHTYWWDHGKARSNPALNWMTHSQPVQPVPRKKFSPPRRRALSQPNGNRNSARRRRALSQPNGNRNSFSEEANRNQLFIRELQYQLAHQKEFIDELQKRYDSISESASDVYQEFRTLQVWIAELVGLDDEEIPSLVELKEHLLEYINQLQQTQQRLSNDLHQMMPFEPNNASSIESQEIDQKENIGSEPNNASSSDNSVRRRSKRICDKKGAPVFVGREGSFPYHAQMQFWSVQSKWTSIWNSCQDKHGRERTLHATRCWVKKCDEAHLPWHHFVTNSEDVEEIVKNC